MQCYVGTSGYSYPAWKGRFYPPDLASGDMLRHYAGQLPAVELNNTFYRVPRADVVRAWAAEVPEGFRFAVKATRRITHVKRLKDAGEETGYFLDRIGHLDTRLGCVLFQSPPTARKDPDRLRSFVGLLPEGLRAAFEFRHPSWFDEETGAILAQRNAALVVCDDDDDEAEPALHATADWGYLRLRRSSYDAAGLKAWSERVRAQPWTQAYVFFKHEDEGPELARRFLAEATGSH